MSAPNLSGLRHWSRNEEARMVELRESGVSRRQIAQQLERSFKAIKARLELVRALGLMR